MSRESIQIVRGALDEVEGGDIILRGVVNPDSLRHLRIAPYQREIAPLARINELAKAFVGGAVPDIDLGMRGGDFTDRDGSIYLRDPVFIIDGLQRVTAALHLMDQGGNTLPHLGAAIHFNTTEKAERARFRILNSDRAKVSPNVLLRNMKKELPFIAAMIHLTEDRAFVLVGKVSWDQRLRREHLITALTLLKVIGRVHSHLGPGRSSKVDDLAQGLQKIMVSVGKNVMLENIQTFFDLVDECWGIRRIAYKEGAVWMRNSFLLAVAELLSRHPVFWQDNNRLYIDRSLVRKMATFPVDDPSVVSLASSSGKSRRLLYQLFEDHVNSGKRSRRLVPREDDSDAKEEGTTQEDAAEQEAA